MSRRRGLTMVAAGALCLLLGGTAARATFPGKNGPIAFGRLINHKVQIFVVNANGSHLKRLTHGPFLDQHPSISPDGKRIAFDRNHNGVHALYVMNINGSHQMRVTHGSGVKASGVDPAFSANGRKLVFEGSSSCPGNTGQVRVIGVDGRHDKQITHDCSIGVLDPTFSPNGRTIAFGGNFGLADHIYLVDASGKHLRAITQGLEIASEPTFSPNGKQIVFHRTTTTGKFQIWMIGSNGKGMRQITNDPTGCVDAAFSPDGKKIVATCFRKVGNTVLDELFVMSAAGKHPKHIAVVGSSQSPDWGPKAH